MIYSTKMMYVDPDNPVTEMDEVDMLSQATLRHTDKMAEETAKQLYALQEQIDELRRMSTVNKILATAQQKTIDLSSERLDKVIGAIVIAREEEESEK